MAKDPREYGYEGDMAISQLKSIMTNAEKLMSMLKPETDLPEWVQLKITLAQDYVLTARDYMESEMKESVDEACWSGYVAKGMKNKGGRMVPNCVPAEAVTTEKPPFEGPYKKADKKPVTRSHLKSLTKAARDTINKSSQKKSK